MLQEQTKKEAEQKALALQAQAVVQTVPVKQAIEPVKSTVTKLEVKQEVVEKELEKPAKEKENN